MNIRLLIVGVLALPLLACSPSEPSELQPTFDALEGLPGLPPQGTCTGEDCCLAEGWCLDVETLSVRNVGGRTVTLEEVRFEAVDDDPDGVDAFSDLVVDTMEVEPEGQASLRFRYTTPGGAAQAAKIVIESSADVNPTLEVRVQTNAWVPPVVPDAGPEPADAGTDDDAGASEDAGAGDDAGVSEDAGAGDDAGGADAG